MLDENTKISDEFFKLITLPLKSRYTEILYACSLDEAAVNIENERKCNAAAD